MKKRVAICCVALLLLIVIGVGSVAVYKGQHRYDGHYTAVDPPQETGETVILELQFDGDRVTMISGNIQQQVKYRIKGDTFTIFTDFGDFSYEIAWNGQDEIILDGVVYRK